MYLSLSLSLVIFLDETVTMAVEEDAVLFDEPVTFKARMQRQLYGPINMGAAIAIGLAVLMI